MTIKSIKPEAADIRTEACAWMSQLESGEMRPADVDSFREWMQRSPRHRSEMRRLAQLSSSLNALAVTADAMDNAIAGHKQAIAPRRASKLQGARPWLALAAVAIICIAVVLVSLPGQPSSSDQQWPLLVSTAIGEYREELLPDGSQLALNTDSQVEVVYTDKGRDVRLLQGEVLFTVAPDPDRPFTVRAGAKSIQAVGTVFLVRHESEKFEVTVSEGKVRLKELLPTNSQSPSQGSPSENPGRQSARVINTRPEYLPEGLILQAGERFSQSGTDVRYEPEAIVLEAVTDDELRRQLAWQEGLLEFTDMALEQVIFEVNRHTTLKIEIPDPALRNLRFGGVFKTGDTAPLFKALESAFDIQAVSTRDDTVQLIRADG